MNNAPSMRRGRDTPMTPRALVAIVLLLFPASLVEARTVAGPYTAEIVRVIDGDTVEVKIREWGAYPFPVRIRLDGVDTPEKGARAKCPGERTMGDRASAHTKRFIGQHRAVTVSGLHLGKFAGRFLGSISIGGVDLAASLKAAGLAREYHGEKRLGWCK